MRERPDGAPTAAQLERGDRARVLPRMPAGIADPRLRLLRGAPSGPVATSYAEQAYRVRDWDRVEYLLKPVAQTPAKPPPPADVVLPVHLISGWHRDGEASTYGPNQGGHDMLQNALLAEAAYPIEQAVAFPPDQSWYEEVLLAGGLTDEQAVEVGRTAGQAAVVRWDSQALTVLPTGLRGDIAPSRSAWQLTRLRTLSCPMRLDDARTGRCQLYGGPFTSGSLHRAALWRAHRDVALGLLGCDPCDHGALPIWGPFSSGNVVSLADEIIGSRYGSYGWHP